MSYNLIGAVDLGGGIGYSGGINWKLPEDLARFQKLTQESRKGLQSVVIMGRKTWESIPPQFRPLSNRLNLIISHKPPKVETDTNVKWVSSPEKAHCFLETQDLGNRWVIGGESIYQSFLEAGHITRVYLTRIQKKLEADTFLPSLNSGPNYFQLSNASKIETSERGEWGGQCAEETGLSYQYLTYSIYPKSVVGGKGGEYNYLNLIDTLLHKGLDRPDRTGIGTRSLFGYQMRFSLVDSFPLLTTKKMFLRGVVEELLWFLRGETDASILREKGVNIWEGNSSRQYLDSIGLTHYQEGDCGPIYGFNFRHFGAGYQNCTTDYSGQGTDQLRECVRLIKQDPFSRRIMINLWNPGDLDKVALPPCHVLYQFYVEPSEDPTLGNWLSCSLYQRSGDVGLGVPFNIASASLLTYIIAQLTGTRPKELIHSLGDAHIYQNHIDALSKQKQRQPLPFPQIQITQRGQENPEDFCCSDFELVGYQHHPPVKMSLAV